MRWTRGTDVVDDDPAVVDLPVLHRWLSEDAYWWQGGLHLDVLRDAVARSTTLSCFDDAGSFVAFGRLVTDRATFAYWCDVFVHPDHRGRGLGTWLTETALAHPHVRTCRRVLLATRDAHEVYARVGFAPLAQPEAFLEVVRPDAARLG
jgi:GNAT superfamily N-acetyltransferase